MNPLRIAPSIVIAKRVALGRSRPACLDCRAPRGDIAIAIRRVLDMRNIIVNRPAIQAGLNVLNAGGDFADGVIAYDGEWLGGDVFVSFDKKAAKLLEGQGRGVLLLS